VRADGSVRLVCTCSSSWRRSGRRNATCFRAQLWSIRLSIWSCVLTRNLFGEFTYTFREPTDGSMRPDAALLRYDSERRALRELAFIPETICPAYRLVKESSSVSPMLQPTAPEAAQTVEVNKTSSLAHFALG
jgi:hypothetical protein